MTCNHPTYRLAGMTIHEFQSQVICCTCGDLGVRDLMGAPAWPDRLARRTLWQRLAGTYPMRQYPRSAQVSTGQPVLEPAKVVAKAPRAEVPIPQGHLLVLSQDEWDELCDAAKSIYEDKWPRVAETFPFYYVLKCTFSPDRVDKIVDHSIVRAIERKDALMLAEMIEEWTSCYG